MVANPTIILYVSSTALPFVPQALRAWWLMCNACVAPRCEHQPRRWPHKFALTRVGRREGTGFVVGRGAEGNLGLAREI